MENIIYNELRSREYNVDVGLVELGGKEVGGASCTTYLGA
jgi:putative ATPase